MPHNQSKLQAALSGREQQENKRLMHENMTLKEVNVLHQKNMVEQSKRLTKTENELAREKKGRTMDWLKAVPHFSNVILERGLFQSIKYGVWEATCEM